MIVPLLLCYYTYKYRILYGKEHGIRLSGAYDPVRQMCGGGYTCIWYDGEVKKAQLTIHSWIFFPS